MTAILLTPRQGHTHDQNDISVEVDLDLLAPVFASVLCFEVTPSPFPRCILWREVCARPPPRGRVYAPPV